MPQLTISIPAPESAFVHARIESGEYPSASEYLVDLVRREQQRLKAESDLRRMLEQAESSGVSKRTVEDIWEDVERRYLARNARL
jgi:antitoxin ParD1/3/4